jgi:hypothetical protein
MCWVKGVVWMIETAWWNNGHHWYCKTLLESPPRILHCRNRSKARNLSRFWVAQILFKSTERVHLQLHFLFWSFKISQLLRMLWQLKNCALIWAQIFFMSTDFSIVTYTVMLRILRCTQVVSTDFAIIEHRFCNSSTQKLQFFSAEFWGVWLQCF